MAGILTLIRGGRIVVPGINGKIVDGQALLCDDHIIGLIPEEKAGDALREREARVIDARGDYISPGFIDIHTHGADGFDVMDGTDEALSRIGRHKVKTGVTAWLPTTLTAPLPAIDGVLDTVRRHAAAQSAAEAEILGVHLEGPFIDAAYKGAHDERFIIPPDSEWAVRNADILKIVTYDPAKDETGEFTRALAQKGIVPSMGHGGATCALAQNAAMEGARSFTHLFNAMSGLHHREPGMVGAAFSLPLWVELIADGIHVNAVLFEPICRVKGVDKVVLVTDSMRAAGLGDGEYELGGLAVTVAEGAARLAGSGVLAGSVLEINVAMRNMREVTGRPVWEIVGMVTANPARLIEANHGRGMLNKGAPADLTIFDGQFNIRKVLRLGQEIL